MQVLKKHKKEKIIKAAVQEFLNKNYKVASMRSIARRVGISVSNLYNYFQNKAELFDYIVSPAIQEFQNTFNTLQSSEEGHDFTDSQFIDKFINLCSDKIGNLLYNYHAEFQILLEKSMGTKYENYKQQVVDEITEHFLEHSIKRENNKHLMHIISTNFINGLIVIAKIKLNKAAKIQLLNNFMRYHLNGIQRFF